jgi:hypothetical protein
MTANAQRERESNDAAESRRRLGRMKRSTNGGAYAVCADEHVASGRLAICEQQRAATAIHGETCRLTGPCDHIETYRVEECAMQGRPQRYNKWTAEHLPDRELSALQQRAIRPPDLTPHPHGRKAPRHDDVREAELAQRRDGIWREDDAEPQRAR